MIGMELSRRKKAWCFAHKLITMVKVVPQREGKELVNVRTEEICKAMDQPSGAKLEDVQKFVYEVIEFMQGYDMDIICGCGYLSMMVSTTQTRERAIRENREPTSFVPDSIDKYLDDYILDSQGSCDNYVRQICDVQGDTNQ